MTWREKKKGMDGYTEQIIRETVTKEETKSEVRFTFCIFDYLLFGALEPSKESHFFSVPS